VLRPVVVQDHLQHRGGGILLGRLGRCDGCCSSRGQIPGDEHGLIGVFDRALVVYMDNVSTRESSDSAKTIEFDSDVLVIDMSTAV